MYVGISKPGRTKVLRPQRQADCMLFMDKLSMDGQVKDKLL